MKQAFRKHHAPYNSFELTIEIVHIYTTTLTFTLVYTSNTTLLYIQIVFLVYQIICLLYQMCDIIRTLLYIQIVNFVLQMVNISPPQIYNNSYTRLYNTIGTLLWIQFVYFSHQIVYSLTTTITLVLEHNHAALFHRLFISDCMLVYRTHLTLFYIYALYTSAIKLYIF
jgi:hypothetical protein